MFSFESSQIVTYVTCTVEKSQKIRFCERGFKITKSEQVKQVSLDLCSLAFKSFISRSLLRILIVRYSNHLKRGKEKKV